MANFLDYGIYDLKLTMVKNNTELRKLFIETTGKSIIVIEDIDCFVNLTGKRRKDKKTASDKDANNDDKPELPVEPKKDDVTKVTLSGLLNFIDGQWSSCGGERIIIFTTNHKEKLDSVLIRRGRVTSTSRCPTTDSRASREPDAHVKEEKEEPDECLTCLIEVLKQAKEDTAATKVKEAEEAKEAATKKAEEKEEAEVKKAKEEDKGKDKAPWRYQQVKGKRGRMDKHIEMSYCRFEGFKVLVKNYLDIVEHGLIEALKQAKEDAAAAKAKANEEEEAKAEKAEEKEEQRRRKKRRKSTGRAQHQRKLKEISNKVTSEVTGV
ncbi:hypothetical protein VPH35_140284 [Triticum aestivum]